MPSPKVMAAEVNRKLQVTRRDNPSTKARQGFVSDDPEITRLQEDMRAQSDKMLKGTPFREGTILTIDFNDAITQVLPHRLGGPAQGFIVVKLEYAGTAAVSIFQEKLGVSTTDVDFSQRDTHIKLRASDVCKAKIWVWR